MLFNIEIVYSRGTNFGNPVETSASYYFCTYRAAIRKHLTQVATSSSFGPLMLFTAVTVVTVVITICLLLFTDCIIVVIAQLMTIGVAKIAEEQDFSTMLMTKTDPL